MKPSVLFLTAILIGCSGQPSFKELEPDEYALEKRLLERANAGDVSAMERLGAAYADGADTGFRMFPGATPTPKERAESIRWYTRAAELGSTTAMTQLADLILLGYASQGGEETRGMVRVDWTEREWREQREVAGHWLRRAAETGGLELINKYADFLSGKSAWWSHPTPKEKALSVRWYRKAAQAGHEEARSSLALVLGDRPEQAEADDHLLFPKGPSQAKRFASLAGLRPALPRKPKRTVAELERYLATHTRDAEALTDLATWHAWKGRFSEGVACASRALKQARWQPRATVVLAACYLRQSTRQTRLNESMVSAAHTMLDRAQSIHCLAPLVWVNLGVAKGYLAIMSPSAPLAHYALELIEVGLYLDPSLEVARSRRGVLRKLLRAHSIKPVPAKIEKGNRELLNLPNKQTPASRVAWKLVDRGWARRGAQRLADFKLALKHDPRSLQALNALGRVQYFADDLVAAERTFSRALSVRATRSFFKLRGLTRMRRGNLHSAIEDFTRAGEREGRGLCRLLLGKRKQGLDDLDRRPLWLAGLRARPVARWKGQLLRLAKAERGNEIARFHLGRITPKRLLKTGSKLKHARARRYWRSQALCHLGLASEHSNPGRALRYYEACLDLGEKDSFEYCWALARVALLKTHERK